MTEEAANAPPRPQVVQTIFERAKTEDQPKPPATDPITEAVTRPPMPIALKISELCLLYRLKVEVLQNWIVTGIIPVPSDIDALNEGDCVRISLMQFFTTQGWSVGWASGVVRYVTDDIVMTHGGAYLQGVPIGNGTSVTVSLNPHRHRIQHLFMHKDEEMAKGSEELKKQAHQAQEMLKEVVKAGSFKI